jgi:hypothetical protein
MEEGQSLPPPAKVPMVGVCIVVGGEKGVPMKTGGKTQGN